ncbi:argininosuccinate lyase [Aurantimonas endophytica]|uniref:Argininosuccinate lyase n=1 Tax=Aurantimonas endophytica TaxID=1522175 RepID=A0A7W6HF50_9HYPH|nr:argininosuccinate lyase [Aurantimonas endophytica]MBB4003867.1 argininosuccinate lyase [Aurantimonas endophytica]MCO6404717.1 argininosuccinate lyase [Aurantimonas endophytica]
MKNSPAGDVSLRERVSSPPAPSLVASYYAYGVAAGLKHTFGHEMNIHLAHALMLADQEIVAPDAIRSILDTLLALQDEGPEALEIDYKAEDVYSYVERYIIGALGPDVGGRLHTGRSRNDLHTTAWRMALRARLIDLLQTVGHLRTTLIELAADHVETVMPGYTHTQHAQPITFGYYLVAASDGLERDFRRLRAALDCCDRSPLGAGALATTGFPISREATREMLGFADLVEVAYEAVASRDDLQESAAALAILMTGVSRLATDLQSWNTMEFGFIEFDDAYSSVSSIMPQKKNPATMEHVKAIAGMATGMLGTVLSCAKNTAFADVNDGVSAANPAALDTIERAALALTAFDGALATLKVRAEAMRRSAEIGYGTATELADVIVRSSGLSFRMAHNVVGRVVREALERGRTADEIKVEDVEEAAEALFGRRLGLTAAEVTVALDPMENVRSRQATGGPAPERMEEMIKRRRELIAHDQQELAVVSGRIEAAYAELEARVRAFSPADVQSG